MSKNYQSSKQQLFNLLTGATKLITVLLFLMIGATLSIIYYPELSKLLPKPSATAEKNEEIPTEPIPASLTIKDGKDVETGLADGEGLLVVKGTCTACHSSQLVLQNRFTRERWHEVIKWMQETQGLWDLGENEAVILDYLAEHYAPDAFRGRRKPLENIDWYVLENE